MNIWGSSSYIYQLFCSISKKKVENVFLSDKFTLKISSLIYKYYEIYYFYINFRFYDVNDKTLEIIICFDVATFLYDFLLYCEFLNNLIPKLKIIYHKINVHISLINWNGEWISLVTNKGLMLCKFPFLQNDLM